MSGSQKGFAARWSERKTAARHDEQTDQPDPESAEEIAPTIAQDETADDEVLTEQDFDDVDFEALDKSSDYTRFAKANVPAAIQKKALRKLWESDSVFEVLDGMNDYDEDFTGTGLAGKALKTAYKVGRGFIDDDEKENQPEIAQKPDEDTPATQSNLEAGKENDEIPQANELPAKTQT